MSFDLSNLLIPAVLFFALGIVSQMVRSDLKFPPELSKALSIYLLVGIGLKGGIELASAELGAALNAILAALVLGFATPVIGFYLLRGVVRLDGYNAAAIAAHYGSVSAGTFLTAIAFLGSMGVDYESYPVIMLAVMESPAILVGLLLVQLIRRRDAGSGAAANHTRGVLLEAFTNGSVVLLLGGLVVGWVAAPDSLATITPFYKDMFFGALSLFLLEMGMEAGKRLGDFRRVGAPLVGFGLVMPLLGAAVGLLVGHFWLGFGVGGVTLVGVLAASASYIAVPPAMRLAVPEANPSLYLTLALAVTFPFNVVVGIPVYHQVAQWLAG